MGNFNRKFSEHLADMADEYPYDPPTREIQEGEGGKINVVPYDPDWPNQFNTIKGELAELLQEGEVTWKSIEHIGSTSIPGLAAKPNIDIIVTVSSKDELEKAVEAFNWQRKVPRYTRYPNGGGIIGRESFKMPKSVLPERSVYVINENDTLGQIHLRNYHDVRKVLLENEVLKEKYAKVKLQLSEMSFKYPVMEYGRRKTYIIHKILRTAGWTTMELQRLFELDIRDPESEEQEDYMF